MRKLMMIGMLVSALSTSAALAQITTAPAPNAPVAGKSVPKTVAPKKARSAESIECSKQADAKGLHGKARKTFRSACKKQLLKKA